MISMTPGNGRIHQAPPWLIRNAKALKPITPHVQTIPIAFIAQTGEGIPPE